MDLAVDKRRVGILGGGQLGRMMVEAAHRLNIETVVLDAEGAPAKQINPNPAHVKGSFAHAADIETLSSRCDVLTIEIEHVDASALEKASERGAVVAPSASTVKLIQDKYLQKQHLISHGIATAEAEAVQSTVQSIEAFGHKYGFPFMLKGRTNAYDGKGNYVVKTSQDARRALDQLAKVPLYGEKWAPFVKELAVMVVRTHDNKVVSYPTVETVHKNNVCHLVYAPAPVPDSVQARARELAERAVLTLSGAGIFGVEMFLLEDQSLLINEIAPRPHNSGHYTQDGCVTSQFESHLRAILGLPLPQGFAAMSTPSTHAIMLNLLGGASKEEDLALCARALSTPGANLHLYGKSWRQGRKLGHINIVGGSKMDVETKLSRVLGMEKESDCSEFCPSPLIGVIMGSDSDLPVMSLGADILKKFGVPFEVKIVSAHRTPDKMVRYANEAASRGLMAIIAGAGGAAHLPGMVAAMTTLPVIGVPVKGSTLDGVDSLHSIVQMPRGVPVATVAINNSTNAALLALRILSVSMPEYRFKMDEYQRSMEAEVLAKDDRLEDIGYQAYLGKK